jgi:hypothetical protein
MKELVGYYVAYRKLVSPSPSKLLPEDQFRLYAYVSASRTTWRVRFRGKNTGRGCMIAGGVRTWCALWQRVSCRVSLTMHRYICLAHRRPS